MKVAVGISGGVDSAVAALLCKNLGHDVIGVTMKIWDESRSDAGIDPDRHACYGPEEKEDIEDAVKICKSIDIPLHVIDCTEAFTTTILSYFKKTYRQGKTPNPCVFCNQQLKFGLLPKLLQEQQFPIDYFATGHYARIERDTDGAAHLLMAADKAKDQSYFLYRLTQEQLKRSLFPLGDLTKEQVRKIAHDAGLHVWDKAESQDFYSGDYRDLLQDDTDAAQSGTFIDVNGKILGKHDGIWNYTIGQRKGLGIATGKPLYVIEIDPKNNTVILGEKDHLVKTKVVLTEFNQLAELKSDLSCKIRSSSPLQKCHVTSCNDTEVHLEFDIPLAGICPGQSAVLYDGDVVVGGGIILDGE
jgi:tRNA-specific 2-thiouridylase